MLALLDTLLDELAPQCVYVCLHGSRHGCLARIKGKSKVIERLLLEPLILSECCDYLGWNHVQKRLEEVKESNMAVLVRVQQLHVVDNLNIHVLVCEVKLLAAQQDVLELGLVDLASIWTILVTALLVKQFLDVHQRAHHLRLILR